MQMGETIMVLLAFFILLGIGLVLYAQYQKTSMQRSAADSFEREAVRIALKVSFYPELACSENGVINENCFDLHKVVAFANKVNRNKPGFDETAFLLYETELRDSTIYVEQVFPPPDTATIPFETAESIGDAPAALNRITLYDNHPEENTVSWEKFPTFIPITLRDETKGSVRKDALGMLIIETYRTRFS